MPVCSLSRRAPKFPSAAEISRSVAAKRFVFGVAVELELTVVLVCLSSCRNTSAWWIHTTEPRYLIELPAEESATLHNYFADKDESRLFHFEPMQREKGTD